MGRCRTTAPHASHPTYSLTKPLTLPAMHSLHRTMHPAPSPTKNGRPSVQLSRWCKQLAVLTFSATCAVASWAVDFGAITVNSERGQLLNAEVAIENVPAAESDSVRVRSASDDDYGKNGLTPPEGIMHLVRRRADGSLYMLIRSNSAIREPEVTLLFNVRYSNTSSEGDIALVGTVQRRLTIDIPAAAVQPAAPTSRVVPRGLTASEIVFDGLKSARSQGATMNQMLVALQNENASAFIADNVNLIKAGATVQLPTTAAVLAIDAASANQTIAAQNAAFKARKERLAAKVDAAKVTQDPSKGAVQNDGKEKASTGDRLELAAEQRDAKALEALAEQAAQAERVAAETEAQARVEALQALTEQATQAAATGDNATTNGSSAVATGSDGAPAQPLVSAPALPAGQEKTAASGSMSDTSVATLFERVRAHPIWSHPQVKNPWFNPLLFLTLIVVVWAFWPRRFEPKIDTDGDSPLYSPDVSNALSRGLNPAALSENSADVPGGDPLTRANALWADGEHELAIHTINMGLALRPDRPDYYMALLKFHLDQGANLAYEATARELQNISEPDSAEWMQCCDWGQRLDPGNPLYGPMKSRDINDVTSLKASDLDL